MNTDLLHATPTQRERYAAWAERIASRAKSNTVAQKFHGYAQIARCETDGFYQQTPGIRRLG